MGAFSRLSASEVSRKASFACTVVSSRSHRPHSSFGCAHGETATRKISLLPPPAAWGTSPSLTATRFYVRISLRQQKNHPFGWFFCCHKRDKRCLSIGNYEQKVKHLGVVWTLITLSAWSSTFACANKSMRVFPILKRTIARCQAGPQLPVVFYFDDIAYE